jgi:hypothetical protein
MRAFLALVWCAMTYTQTVRFHLSLWITHLLTAVPPRSRATFVERKRPTNSSLLSVPFQWLNLLHANSMAKEC